MKKQYFAAALLVLNLSACGDDSGGGGGSGGAGGGDGGSGGGGGSCAQPSDAPTGDDVQAGGTSFMCYNAPGEGYCWETTNAFTVSTSASDGKNTVGCTDGIAVTDGTCPTDTAIGRCDGWGTEEDRVYYECNKFDSIFPDGIDAECEGKGGTWTAL